MGWTKESGQYRAHLYASTLRRSGTAAQPIANLAEAVLERMASFLGDNGSSPVTVDRSPPQAIEAAMAEYIAKAEATGEWKAERRSDGTWALERVRPPKHRGTQSTLAGVSRPMPVKPSSLDAVYFVGAVLIGVYQISRIGKYYGYGAPLFGSVAVGLASGHIVFHAARKLWGLPRSRAIPWAVLVAVIFFAVLPQIILNVWPHYGRGYGLGLLVMVVLDLAVRRFMPAKEL